MFCHDRLDPMQNPFEAARGDEGMTRDIADRDVLEGTLPLTCCVLVVEDDAMLRRVVVQTLQSWGFDTEEAHDGGAAVDRVSSGDPPFGVMLLDIWLPVM